MLIEHINPCARTLGALILIPGINKVDDKRWDHLAKSAKWAGPIKGLIADGILKVQDARHKLTIAMVEKTYDPELLADWLSDPVHKGPLRGALKKQLAAIEVDDDTDKL